MRKLFSFILIFILLFDIISFSYFDSVCASEWSENDPEWVKYLDGIFEHPADLILTVLQHCGAIFSVDAISAAEASLNYKSKLDKWYQDGKIKVSSSSAVGGSGITIDASVTQEILDDFKQYADDNGGYTLIPTVPISKFSISGVPNSTTAFPSDTAYYNTKRIFSNNEGFLVFGISSRVCYFGELPSPSCIFVRLAGTEYGKYGISAYTEMSGSRKSFKLYYPSDFATKDYSSYDELTSSSSYITISYFGLYDYFYDSHDRHDVTCLNPERFYLCSVSGVSVPVFDSIDDYIAYSVGNGLYYTGSGYDGVGKEITITADDIQKIQDGYYDGMYEQLQKLIEENNVSPLDYEKLAELADQVLNSLGDIEQNTGESNTILQKILDVLNDMNGFLHTNLAGSSDIDLSALYSRLDSVVNELRSMSSALVNISSSSGGSFDVDVGGIENRLDGMASQLAKEADTLESLNNAVDGTNSTLAELNSSISDLSSSLDEMYSALDGLKLDTDNTDVVNKLNEVQEQIQFTNSRLGDVYDVIHKYLPLMSDILQELKDIHKAQVGFGLADTAVDILQGLLDDLGNVLSGIIELPEVNIRLALDDFNKAYEDTGAVEMLKKKFPFSIPWDIAFLVGFLADEPQAPKFELPLVFEKYGINERLVIDFGDFEVVSKVSRTLLTIIYLVALMKFTTNIITKE